jgi:hypothetical protein
MQRITSESSLREAILLLKSKQADEERLMKEQFQVTVNSIKPLNLIKGFFKDASGSQDIKDNLVSTSVGLTAGYVSKLLFQGLTKNPVKKLLGTAIMFGITNIIAKNPEAIKSIGKRFFKLFRKKQKIPINVTVNIEEE